MLPIAIAFFVLGTTNVDIEILKNIEAIQRYFPDSVGLQNRMIAISKCESEIRQFKKNGEVVENEVTKDFGILQVNARYHKETARKLGHDINTLSGNLGYSRVLFDTYGLSPWLASKECTDKIMSRLLAT